MTNLVLRKNNDAYFLIIKNKYLFYSINFNDIYFIEKKGKKVYIMLYNKIIEYYGSLYQLEYILKRNSFFKCHQSYIVNCKKILLINKDEIEFNDIKNTIFVSDRYKDDLINKIESEE